MSHVNGALMLTMDSVSQAPTGLRTSEPSSDAELVEAARLDSSAFEPIMRRYNRRLFRVARSILRDADAAEDAVQEAYIRAFTHLSQYAPTGSFIAWLTRIVINEALMLQRREKRGVLSFEAIADMDAHNSVAQGAWHIHDALATSDDSEQACVRQLLEQALDRLPQKFRIVFVLREVEQLSIAETADCLGLNAATVKTRLHRARTRLRADLTRCLERERLQIFDFGGERCNRVVARVLTRLSGASMNTPIALSGLLTAFVLAASLFATPTASADEADAHVADVRSDINALREIRKGREIFRYATFGDEDFWGGTLGLHEAIAGAANGGVGAGLSPKAALSLGLKVDVDALPSRIRRGLRAGRVNLNDPAVTVALLRLNAVVGVTGFFDNSRRLKAVGIQCALCHSVVDDSFSSGIGRRLDGWANRDLNVGRIIALAPRLQVFTDLLGVDEATVRKVLLSWGPGKFDAELVLDGKAFRPDGRPAATLLPPAFGLAGVNLHTWTGWGSVTHWNAFVANLEMHGKGTFYDPRLDDADRFPIAAREGFGHITAEEDQITPALAPLHLYQLSLEAPAAPRGSYNHAAAMRGRAIFSEKARCASCHVPPLYTEPGWNMHTAEEIGIDDFQAQRAPDGRYRTAPLRGLWTHTKGGFYHDGRFAKLADVITHYDEFFDLGLTAGERRDLEEFLKSL